MRQVCLLAVLVLVGCCKEQPMYTDATLRCHRCGRVTYEGKMAHWRNGFMWPEGKINRCKPGDKLCLWDSSIYGNPYEHGESCGQTDAHNRKPINRFDDGVEYDEDFVKGYNDGFAKGVK